MHAALLLVTLCAAPPLTAVAYRPDGQQIAVGGYGEVTVLDAANAIVRKHTGLPHAVTAVAWAADGRLAVACGQPGKEGRVRTFAADGKPLADFVPHKDAVYGLAFAPDGSTLATGSYDRLVKLSDPATGRELKALKDHSDSVYAVAFLPDGSRLASVAADRAVKLWDTATGQRLSTLGDSTDWLYAVAVSPDGSELAAAGVDKSVRVWKLATPESKLARFTFAHDAPVIGLHWSRDGRTLLTLAENRTLKLWDAATLRERLVLPPTNAAAAALSPDGTRVALARRDGSLVLLDAADGKQVAQPLPEKPKPPSVGKVEGDAVPRGRTTAVTLHGSNLADATVTATGDVKVAVRSTTADKLVVEVTPGNAAMIGPLTLTVTTPGGSATATVHVDWFPGHAGAAAPTDTPHAAPVVPLDRTFVGTLDRAGDVDAVRFDLATGQEVGATVTIPDGAKFDPRLEWLDPTGTSLVTGGTAVAFTAPTAGRYALAVRDREFRGGGPYRLHVGAVPVVSGIYPLGVSKGGKATAELFGVHLGPTRTITVAAGADKRAMLSVSTPHGAPLNLPSLAVGEFPAPPEPGRLALPSTADGRFTKPGQTAEYRFAATKGEPVVLEVEARRLGSPVDPWVEVVDAAGRPIPRAELRCVAKTFLNFRDVDSAQPGIRLEVSNELALDDYMLIDGELMRMSALPEGPDSDARFYTTAGQRIAYLGTSPSFHAQGVNAYKVQVFPPGTALPPNGLPRVTLFYRNDDGGPGYGKDAAVTFDPPTTGEYRVRVGDSRSAFGPAHGYRLTLRPPRPDFKLTVKPQAPAVPPGGAAVIDVTATRLDGFAGPIVVRPTDLPPGYTAGPSQIDADQFSTQIVLHASGDSKPANKPLKLVGEATVGGQPQSRTVTAGVPKAGPAGDIVCRVLDAAVELKPGGQASFTVEVERLNGFKGRIPVEVRGLPHGVKVMDIGLNGILITERETKRRVVLYAEPWVEPGSRPLAVLAKREGKNSEHVAPALPLTVK